MSLVRRALGDFGLLFNWRVLLLAGCAFFVLLLLMIGKRGGRSGFVRVDTQNVIVNLYTDVALVEKAWSMDIRNLLRDGGEIPWNPRIEMPDRLRILCEVSGYKGTIFDAFGQSWF